MIKRGYSRFIKFIHFAGDIILLNVSFLLTYLLYNEINPLFSFNDHYIFLLIAFNLLWIILVLILKLYNIERTEKLRAVLFHLIRSIFFHALLVIAFMVSIKGYYYSRGHLLFTYISSAILILIWRLLFIYILRHYRRSGSNYRTVVIIGAGALGNRMYNYFKSEPSSGYKFLGFFDDDKEFSKHKDLILGSINDLEEYSRKERIDEIYYALPLIPRYKFKELMSFADNNMIRFKIVPDFRGFLDKKVNIDFYKNVPVLSIRREPMENVFNMFFKRLFDLVFSLCIIIFVFPWLFTILILLVKATSRGPVFFKQKRSGRNNEEFYCYKFRTMNVNEEADSRQASLNDPRITLIGRYLRRVSLDELPQFYNVLIGNMTIVGPRPHMLKHTEDYSKIVDKFMVRQFVKPGITGLAQIKGFRGETQDPEKMTKRIRYDLWYMENWSFLLDLKIIFLTVFTIFKSDKNAV